MEHLDVGPLETVRGTIKLPSSKSISNRVLLLAILVQGETMVCDLLGSDGTHITLEALSKLGVSVESLGDNTHRAADTDGRFPDESADLFMGNAGTAIRPLAAVLALQGGEYTLHGVPRMHERPIGGSVDGLRRVGARIDYMGDGDYPSLVIHVAPAKIGAPIRVCGDVSSQFLTVLLMTLLLIESVDNVTIEVVGELISKFYAEITLNLATRFSVQVVHDSWSSLTVPIGVIYKASGKIFMESDASSTSYFLTAGAPGDGPVHVEGVSISGIQGDIHFTNAFSRMGASIMAGDSWVEMRDVERDDSKSHAVELDRNHIPDATMMLVVTALFADGTTTFTDIASWRVRETDRPTVIATKLRKPGAGVEEGAGYIRATPPSQWTLPAGGVDTYDDHRTAMVFSLVAFDPASVQISDPRCVGKTFPEYFTVFGGITA